MPNSLREKKFKAVYRSGDDNLYKDFYLPAISCAKTYDRAVGFFSSSLLTYALKGVSSIVDNDGKIRLVIGYPLSEDEFLSMKEGELLQECVDQANYDLLELLEEGESKIDNYRYKLFCLLVATKRLEIKFAFKLRGMYHEKIGIVRDVNGDKVLFVGSANETMNAMHPDLNYESVTVYSAWNEDVYTSYASVFEEGFEKIWEGRDSNVYTLELSSTVYEKIAEKYRDDINDFKPQIEIERELVEGILESGSKGNPIIPSKMFGKPFQLKKHQAKALRSWFSFSCSGLFKMATGSGKTITAIYGASQMFLKAEGKRKMVLLISVPYQNLAEQWVRELGKFSIYPIKCFYARKNWDYALNSAINSLNLGEIEFFSAVVVNRTLASEVFQASIGRLSPDELFFVGDECHRHASERMINALPSARFKIGLSATPYIDNDDEYQESLEKTLLTSYYGDVVGEYSLSEALADDVLCEYNYFIYPVYLNVGEWESYCSFTKNIAVLMNADRSNNNQKLQHLIRERARLIGNCKDKKDALVRALADSKIEDKAHTLFYAGEGKSFEDDEDVSSQDQNELLAIAQVLSERGWRVSRFTSHESKKDREKIMRDFTSKNIDALVSMKVLDEGVDIPECKRAFILASSTNPRQFVQRRGRILRKAEGKSHADVYDFLVLPPPGVSDNFSEGIVKRELARATDFIRLCKNRVEVEDKVKGLIEFLPIELEDC